MHPGSPKFKLFKNNSKNNHLINIPETWLSITPHLIFLIITMGYHFREVFFGEVCLFSDHIHIMARFFDIFLSPSPWKSFQWTDNIHFGFSWAREMGALFFHFPDCLLMRVFSPFRAVLISTLFMFYVAQIFTYLYLRLFDASRLASIIGAIMFTFSASITRQYIHYDFLMIITTTPLLFWFAESLARHFNWFFIVLITLVIGNNLFTPHPQYVGYQIPTILIYFGIRVFQLHDTRKGIQRCYKFIFVLLFAVLISAPFLLPFQDQIFDSVTSKGREGNYSTFSGTSGFRLFVLFHALLAPKAVGSDVVHDIIPSLVEHSWIWSIYLGMIPWFCSSCLWKLRHRSEFLPLFGIAIASVLFFVPNMFVPVLPDFRTVYSYIPGWNMFHHYERFLFLSTYSMSVLLALSIDAWSRKPGKFDIYFPFLLFTILSILSLSSSVFQYFPGYLPEILHRFFENLSRQSGSNYIIHTAMGSRMSVLLMLSFLLIAARYWFHMPRNVFLLLTLLFLTGDLMLYGLQYKPTLDKKSFLSPPKLAKVIPKGKRFICATSRDSWIWRRDINPFEARRCLGASLNLYFKLSEVGGFTLPVLTKEEYLLFNLMLAEIPMQGPWHKRSITDPSQFSKVLHLWRLYSIDYMITDITVNHSDLFLVERDDDYLLYKIKNALPRAYCSSQIQFVNNWNTVIRKLTKINNINDYKPVVLVQNDMNADIHLGEGIVQSLSGSNTDLIVNVETKEKGTFLVLTDRWAKEWQATIDTQPTYLFRVNGMQRGVLIPPGRHIIRFQYYDKHLMIGLCLSFSSLLILFVILVWLLIHQFIKTDKQKSIFTDLQSAKTSVTKI